MSTSTEVSPRRRALSYYGLAVLLALGAVLLGFTGASHIYDVQRANVVVPGKVTELTRQRGSTNYVDCPTIEYQHGGFTQQRMPNVSDCDGQPVGTTLQVRFDPDDPQNWHVDSFKGRYMIPIFSFIVTLVCSLGFLVALLRARAAGPSKNA